MFGDEIWKSLDSKMAGSSKYSETLNGKINKAIFDRDRSRIMKNVQHESCRVMFHLQMFFWSNSMFTCEVWRKTMINSRVQSWKRKRREGRLSAPSNRHSFSRANSMYSTRQIAAWTAHINLSSSTSVYIMRKTGGQQK